VIKEYNNRTAVGTSNGVMSTSSQSLLQSVYATRVLGLPPSMTDWSGSTALVFYVMQSSASSLTNNLSVRFTGPDYRQFTTNLPPGTANTPQLVAVLTNNLGAFISDTHTNVWKLEADFQNMLGSTNVIFEPVIWCGKAVR